MIDRDDAFFQGVYALLLTPFKEDLSIDWDAYERYVDWQCSHSPHLLFAACGSSEMQHLNLEERLKLTEIAVKRAGNIPVVATANLERNHADEIEEVKRMEATGVSALVFITKGKGADQAELESYLVELCQHTTLPVLLYEFPGYDNYLMEAETYGRLVKKGQVRGIKDTTCTFEGIDAKIKHGAQSAVLQANIPWLLDSLRHGAQGVMATTSTSAVQLLIQLWDAVQSASSDAEDIHAWLCMISAISSAGFPGSSKLLASLQGVQMTSAMRSGQTLPSQRIKAIQTLYAWARRNEILS